MGPGRVSFVKNAATGAQAHPEIFPASFDTAGFLEGFSGKRVSRQRTIVGLTSFVRNRTDPFWRD
jgi:hypothetical protein